MRKYEMLLVLPGTYDDKEAEAKTNEVVAVINELGSGLELKPMGKNRLAYPIQQVRYGYFYTLIFSAEPENLNKIEEKLKLVRGLLRAVISHYNKALDHAENKAYFGGAQVSAEEMIQEEIPAVAREVEATPVQAMSEIAEQKSEAETDESIVVKEGPRPVKQVPLDLKEIDRKLDEILSDDNINI